MARKKKQAVNLSHECFMERDVYSDTTVYKPVLTQKKKKKKKWQRHFTMGNETLIPTTKSF